MAVKYSRSATFDSLFHLLRCSKPASPWLYGRQGIGPRQPGEIKGVRARLKSPASIATLGYIT